MPAYYPPAGFHFRVEFGNVASDSSDVRFQEVSGLSAEVGVEDLEEGGENRFTHRLPKRPRYSNLILKRGLLTDSELIKWLTNAIENFVFSTTTVNVTLLNEKHEPLGYAYSFVDAWPVKWSVSDFKAQENAIIVETLELAYKYFRRVKKN
ncbi:phage tail protein [candidate division KSB1 bacterium]|nr:phage tail protein [candidate division KSB1 bacterium]RQW07351.1 MAG: phage tail protein [candidate division KSB1 bacterium]